MFADQARVIIQTKWEFHIPSNFFSVDCVWSGWSDNGACSKTCGGGTKSQIRSKIIVEKNSGSCIGSSKRYGISCNTNYCPGRSSQRLLNRWTSQLDLGCTTGCLERVVSVHNFGALKIFNAS